MVFICISLMTNDVEHFFHMFIAYLNIFCKVSAQIFYFLIGLMVFSLMSFEILLVFWMQVLNHIYALRMFSSNLWLIFILSTVSFEKQRFLILVKSNLPIFILWTAHWAWYLRNLCLTEVQKIFLLCFFQKFYGRRCYI